MFWDEDYSEEYVLEGMGEEEEDVLVTIEYIEEKNNNEIEDANYLNDFARKFTSITDY